MELVGDLTVRSTTGHREQDFFFTARERLGGLSRWAPVAGVTTDVWVAASGSGSTRVVATAAPVSGRQAAVASKQETARS